jgi:hypothetical protein
MVTINPVEEFLSDNKNVIYSIRSLSKELNIKKRQVYYYYTKSDNIIKATPIMVGSGKSKLNIFKYIN